MFPHLYLSSIYGIKHVTCCNRNLEINHSNILITGKEYNFNVLTLYFIYMSFVEISLKI